VAGQTIIALRNRFNGFHSDGGETVETVGKKNANDGTTRLKPGENESIT
jgi:hypothetical protein